MVRFYVLDGACHELPEGATLPDRAIAIERLPEAGERVDPVTGAIVLDPALRADVQADPAAVREAHLIKRAEAAMVLSGYTLTHGLLAGESAATGIALEELAALVLANAGPAMAAEMDRRAMKTGSLEN